MHLWALHLWYWNFLVKVRSFEIHYSNLSQTVASLSDFSSILEPCNPHSQLTVCSGADSEFSCTHSRPMQYVSPALACELSCKLTAALQTADLAICLLWLRLVS